jgi:hypothetical protein
MKKSTSLAIAMLLFLCSNTVLAQTNFTGAWNFKEQESISGNLYGNGSPSKVTITINGSDQKMDYLTSDGQNDIPTSETFTGGKTFETKTKAGRKKVVVLTWSADKNTFTEISSIYSLTDANKLDFKNTDVWTLADGKLILDRKNENFTNGETWESKATYEKQ